MDSFYEPPRKPPVPTALEPVFPVPLVPEVSMIAHNQQFNDNAPLTYNSWKSHNYQQYLSKENCNDSLMFMGASTSFMKKQVRFENPTQKAQNKALTINKEKNRSECSPVRHPPTLAPNLEGKSFQEIYMSNLPNRHLDLSILDVGDSQNNDGPHLQNAGKQCENISDSIAKEKIEHTAENLRKDLPQTYKEFLSLQNNLQKSKENDIQLNDSITDILNYGKSNKCNYELSQQTSNVRREAYTFKKTSNPKHEENNCDRLLDNLGKSNYEECLKHIAPSISTNNEIHNFQKPFYESYAPKENLMSVPKGELDTQTTNIFLNKSHTNKVEQSCVEKEKDNEPTVKDLLKIIQQQNEQLILLQKQVTNLIGKSETQKQIEAPPADNHMLYSKKYVTSTQHEMCTDAPTKMHTPKKGPMSKFSIDMMTSFEVSFRRQQNENFRRKIHGLVNYEPEIDEVTETESTDVLSGIVPMNRSEKGVDSSLHFQAPVQVREDCPSPEPSIKIDMNDYESSDDDSPDDVPMAVYANVMDQIEKLLRNANAKAFSQNSRLPGGDRKTRETRMSKVKEATVKHLKSIGVNIPESVNESDCSTQSSDSCKYTPNQISFAVKQLLMKYLPDEYLARINDVQNPGHPFQMPEEKRDLIPPRPEFSFATVQYMKKYNLLATAEKNDDAQQMKQPIEEINRPGQALGERGLGQALGDRGLVQPKILDITALKQQPKLL